MVRIGVGVVALALLFTACGGGGAATPQAAFEKLQAAVKAKDWGAIYDMAAESVHKEIKEAQEGGMGAMILGMEDEEAKAMPTREFFVKMMDKVIEMEGDDVMNIADAEIKEVKEEGDTATVFFKGSKKDDKQEFIKVDGKWVLAGMD
jgi:hypothetical protein